MKAQRSTRNKRTKTASSQKKSSAPFQFSKLIVIFGAVVFVSTLIYVLVARMDFTTNATALTVTGSVFLTICIWYFKKSQQQNCRHIMTQYSKDMMQVRCEYVERILQLEHKYNVTKDDIYRIESESTIDDDAQNAIAQGNQKLHDYANEAEAVPEIQTPTLI